MPRQTCALLIAVIVAYLTSASPGLAVESAEIEALLPPDSCVVEIMVTEMPPEMEGLARRLQIAMATNEEWFVQYIAESGPGPLPYHEKMGLSEEQYARYLELSKQLRFRVGTRTHLKWNREGSVIQFDGGPGLSTLDDVRIDLEDGRFINHLGDTARVEPLDRPESYLGAWRGYTWILEDPPGVSELKGKDLTTATATICRFSLGALNDGTRGVLNYTAKRAVDGQVVESLQVIALFQP